MLFCENSGKDHRCAAGPAGIRPEAFGILPVGVVMCDWPGLCFRTSPLLYTDEKG